MVQVELDRTRTVKYRFQTIRDLERALDGKPLARILQDLSFMGTDALVTALLFGLKHEDPTLNQNLIMKMLDQRLDDGESLQPVYRAVSQALEATGVFRTSEDVAEGKQKTAAPA